MGTTPSTRTRQVGDAAIAVLADQGARGLTHRAVDQAAGFPPGTTSNYARTRDALLTLALTRIAELDATEGVAGLYETGISENGMPENGMPGSELADGRDGMGAAGLADGRDGMGAAGLADGRDGAGAGLSSKRLADGLAWMVHRMITEPEARRRARARFELALEATRRPELRVAYDDMGRRFRGQASRLLAASGSAEPERDAWTLIAWLEGTAFYALAGAGTTAAPALDVLRDQLTRLLGGLCGDDAGAA